MFFSYCFVHTSIISHGSESSNSNILLSIPCSTSVRGIDIGFISGKSKNSTVVSLCLIITKLDPL